MKFTISLTFLVTAVAALDICAHPSPNCPTTGIALCCLSSTYCTLPSSSTLGASWSLKSIGLPGRCSSEPTNTISIAAERTEHEEGCKEADVAVWRENGVKRMVVLPEGGREDALRWVEKGDVERLGGLESAVREWRD